VLTPFHSDYPHANEEHKVIFGSDGPWLHPGVEIHKIRLLGLSPKQEALMLGGNAWRLIRHTQTGAGAGRQIERVGLRMARGSVSPQTGHGQANNGYLSPGVQAEYEL
jgi:hypothetical protein